MKNLTTLLLLAIVSCGSPIKTESIGSENIIVGAKRFDQYLHLIEGDRVGIVANHSTLTDSVHLVDSLLSLGINVRKIYCPEHGFRGNADAGELIFNHIDSITGLPIVSLYANHRKPSPDDLEGIDVMLFDLQDVGVRFYTYISTMHYVMEACAENAIPLIILDRPNPNGFYVDGPVLDLKFNSFVGMHPVPLVHGMTVGEFAGMINGEGWLSDSNQCSLVVIPCANYTHDSTYILPIRPSPNLPNQTAIYLYPSLGLFEGTSISVGRGTDYPFQIFGHPNLYNAKFRFTPESRLGSSKNPPHLGVECLGVDLREYKHDFFLNHAAINLQWLVFAYQSFPTKGEFFNSYFNLLAGNDTLRKQIEQGDDPEIIMESWIDEINAFMKIRSKYLLYPDSKRLLTDGQKY